jgi:hypothetical protein
VIACTATPVSWIRLERFAIDRHRSDRADAQIATHIAACPACAQCLAEIEHDVVALPPLAVPARRRSFGWWRIAVPVFALAVAALLFWPRDAAREDAVTVKGVGEVILGIVRERDGVIRDDAKTFLPGDRFKIVVTCPPAASAWIDLDVGGDHPLPATRTACGNRVVVPGAFYLTGTAPNRICVRVAAEAAPDASAPRACVTVGPE